MGTLDTHSRLEHEHRQWEARLFLSWEANSPHVQGERKPLSAFRVWEPFLRLRNTRYRRHSIGPSRRIAEVFSLYWRHFQPGSQSADEYGDDRSD